MACFCPVKAYQPLDGGRLVFVEKKDHRTVTVPCGQCIGCRLARQEMWTVRCFAESKMHKHNSFITLTYDEENFPMHGSLTHRDWQLFAKRLRQKIGPFRFFMCGEYGEQLQRPHYHALLFGVNFDDRTRYNGVYAKSAIYQSELLNGVWGKGQATIGEVTYASARYVAAYTLKLHRVLGDDDLHYKRVCDRTGEIVDLQPEYARMSLKPGIGLSWLEAYWKDIYATGHNAMIVNGQRKPIPRYFNDQMREKMPQMMEDWDWSREKAALENWEDNTPERLKAKEIYTKARTKFYEDKKR